jgi:hypothetical protein
MYNENLRNYIAALQDRIQVEQRGGTPSIQIWNRIFQNMQKNYKDLGLPNFQDVIHHHANPFSFECLIDVASPVCQAREERREVWMERSRTLAKIAPELAKLGAATALCPWREGAKPIMKYLGVGSVSYLSSKIFHKRFFDGMKVIYEAEIVSVVSMINIYLCNHSKIRLFALSLNSGILSASEDLDSVWIRLGGQEGCFFAFLANPIGSWKTVAFHAAHLAAPIIGYQFHRLFEEYSNRELIAAAVGPSVAFVGSLAFSVYMNRNAPIDTKNMFNLLRASCLDVAAILPLVSLDTGL